MNVAGVPKLTTDEDAERFLGQDLSGLDFTQFQPAQFEFEAKSERVNMRLPKALLSAVKEKAAIAGVPYQRFIRQALERAVVQDKAQDKAQRTRSAG
jgi:predicted DNA binding CopG/RHH family protein